VRDGTARFQADNGQYLLGLDVTLENGVLHMVERPETVAPSSPINGAAAHASNSGSAGSGGAARPSRSAPSAPAPKTAEQWFNEALELEIEDSRAARGAYEHAVSIDPQHVASWINWGRLLHEQGAIKEADKVYLRAIAQCGRDPLLMFNHGVLLEDLGKTGAAIEAYHAAIEEDPDLADCHFNLARLYEAMGKPQHAIRHLGQYRRLVNTPGN